MMTRKIKQVISLCGYFLLFSFVALCSGKQEPLTLVGSGTFADVVDLSDARTCNNGLHIEMTMKHTYTEPGTYFPVPRVVSQREADAVTPFTRIYDLDRIRVVVI